MENMKKKQSATSVTSNKYENVQVVVRCRPLSEKEKNLLNVSVIDVWPSKGIIEISNPKENNKDVKKTYVYDAVYGVNSTQQNLYDETVRPLVCSVLEGFNGCIFAYGQTGAGKTYTMEGSIDIPEKKGIIPKVFDQIWEHINQTQNSQFLVSIKYLEIYMEEIRDLLKVKPLASKSLELREIEGKGVFIMNLHTINCKNVKDMHRAMRIGNKNRTVSCTNMNTHSSRSHAILQISIERCDNTTNKVHVGKLNLIDLAGSERQSKTGATDDRFKESCKINLALSSLGKVISALSENSPHIPYRDSKLTRLLQDSLGGNSKTIMIANIGPASSNYEETLTTLRYASRAKNISNRPIMNEDPEDTQLREYQLEILYLKKLIAERQKQKLGMEMNNKAEEELSGESETESEDESCGIEIINEQKVELVKSLESEKLTVEELASKLKDLEEQLVEGGQNEEGTEQIIEIESLIYEATDKEKEEEEIKKKLEIEEEENIDLQKNYNTIQQDLDFKNCILSKFFQRWQDLKREITNVKEDHMESMQKLQNTQGNIMKQQKLQYLITDNFIDSITRENLLNSARYDDTSGNWQFSDKQFPNKYYTDNKNLSNEIVQKDKLKNNRKNKSNVLDLKLYEPVKSTISYTKPKIPPKFRKTVEACFKHEAENNTIEVVEPPQSFIAKDISYKELEQRYNKAKVEIISFPTDEKQILDYFIQKEIAKRPISRATSRAPSSRK